MADTTTINSARRAVTPSEVNPQPQRPLFSVRFSLCRNGDPLATVEVERLCLDGAELRADDLRKLGLALLEAAEDCTEERCRDAVRYGSRAARSDYPRKSAASAGRASA